MALYVKVFTSFYSHRKTAKLRGMLGDDALWLMPRIWSHAAEHQPDGDYSSYDATELAMLIGYSKDASRMLEAMQQASFFDGMLIHGWQEHNDYHTTFAERAKKAADARWESHNKKKEAKKNKDIERRGEETSIASSIPPSKEKGTRDEIKAFCASIGLPEADGDACFDKWEGKGWKVGGSRIKCWMSTIRSWKAQGYMPSQKGNHKNGSNRPAESTRNVGTANEGKAHLYDLTAIKKRRETKLLDAQRSSTSNDS